MKKFLQILLVLCMIFSILPASAAETVYQDQNMTIVQENGTYRLSELSFRTIAAEESAVFITYTPDNAVYAVAAAAVTTADGSSSAQPNLALPQDLKFIVKAYFPTQNAILTAADTTEEGIQPSEPTAEPTASPSPAPTATPDASYPPVYDTAAVAMQAFMVVDEINATVAEDGDTVYALKALYQGREIEVTVPDDTTLASAPDVESHLAGASVSALQEGDVIYCTYSFGGRLTDIDLIYRPQSADIITSEEDFGTNFERLFTAGGTVAERWPAISYGSDRFHDNQYAFGLIKENLSGNALVLANKTGLAENDLELDLLDDTIVYSYDHTLRDKLYIGTAADILKSEIPNSAKDEDDNIIAWDTDTIYNYALVRTNDGVVMDMIVFLNYNA